MNIIPYASVTPRIGLAGKVLAVVAVGVLLVLGLVGLVLPLIPGILFLALAAAIVCRHSPAARRKLRQHRGVGRCIDHADGFIDSDYASKAKLAVLYGAKALVDAGQAVTTGVCRWLDGGRPR